MITEPLIQKHEWTVTWAIHTYHCFLSNWPVSAFFCTMNGSLLATTTMGEVAFTIILFNTCSLQSLYTNSSVTWDFWREPLCFLSCRCSRSFSNDNLWRRGSINTGHEPVAAAGLLRQSASHTSQATQLKLVSDFYRFFLQRVLRIMGWNSSFL